MIALLAAVVVASVVGSLHCAGMCGGFVAFYAGAGAVEGGTNRGLWWAHLVYNAGRLLTYAAMGAVAGSVGAALDLAGSAVHLERLAGILAASLMILWGLLALLPTLGVRARFVRFPSVLGRLFGRAHARLRGRPPVVRALAMGLLTTLLPCGWLYAFVIAAAGTGSTLQGTLLMSAFWLGTLPVMVGLGVGVQQLSRVLGRYLPALTAMVVLGLGVVALVSRLTGPGAAAAARAQHQAHKTPQAQVQALRSGKTSHCHGQGAH